MSYLTDSFDGKVIELLRGGGVGLLPSDTIYGLSARALDREAVEKIHRLKGRQGGKPLIVLIANIEMLDLLSISRGQADAVKKYWPGALSLEFKAASAPVWLHRGTDRFAIRLPAYTQLRELINKVGPIVSTSANRAGDPPVRTAGEARDLFGDKLDFYVDGGLLDNPPSTLAAVKDGRLKVIRQGAVKIADSGEETE